MKYSGLNPPIVNLGDGPSYHYEPDYAATDDGGVPPMTNGGGGMAPGSYKEKWELERQARAKALRANPMFRKHSGPSPYKAGEEPKIFDTFVGVQDANIFRLRPYETPGTNKTVEGKREYSTLPALYKPTRAY